jgi:hypothetical protein
VSNVLVNENLICNSGCIDTTHNATIPDTEPVPSRIRNITGRSPVIPFASRDGVRDNRASFCVVQAGAGSGALLENITAVGTHHAVVCYEYGNRDVSGPDVHIDGLFCSDVAISDVSCIAVRNVTVDGYRSIRSARAFTMDGVNSVARFRMSGVFDCAQMGFATETATQRGDIAIFASGVTAGSLIHFNELFTPNAGSLQVTVRCSGLTPANRLHLTNCEWAADPDQIVRVVSGLAPVFTFTGMRRISGTNIGVYAGAQDRFYPEPGTATVTVSTTALPSGSLTDGSAAAVTNQVLGEVIKALKAKGIMP